METSNLHDEEPIPAFLNARPNTVPRDHIAHARSWFESELIRSSGAIKVIDLRMENTAETIVALRRQQAEDQRELEQLTRVRRSAERAIAELDGVEL